MDILEFAHFRHLEARRRGGHANSQVPFVKAHGVARAVTESNCVVRVEFLHLLDGRSLGKETEIRDGAEKRVVSSTREPNRITDPDGRARLFPK